MVEIERARAKRFEIVRAQLIGIDHHGAHPEDVVVGAKHLPENPGRLPLPERLEDVEAELQGLEEAPAATVDPVEQWPWEAWIATALAVTGAVLTFLTAGPKLFGTDKIEVMEALGRGHILWATGATVGFVAAYVARLYVVMVVNLILLALNLLVGFRVEIVIALFTVTYLLLSSAGESKLVERWRRLDAGAALTRARTRSAGSHGRR